MLLKSSVFIGTTAIRMLIKSSVFIGTTAIRMLLLYAQPLSLGSLS